MSKKSVLILEDNEKHLKEAMDVMKSYDDIEFIFASGLGEIKGQQHPPS